MQSAEKRYKMLGYVFEKAYDLAISPTWNVSSNAGFETPLGKWEQSQKA
jgi:hypothetical protein